MFGFLNYITKMTTRNIEDNGKVTTKKGKKKFDINSYDDDDTETKDDIFFLSSLFSIDDNNIFIIIMEKNEI